MPSAPTGRLYSELSLLATHSAEPYSENSDHGTPPPFYRACQSAEGWKNQLLASVFEAVPDVTIPTCVPCSIIM
jgi:hypothetical protein